MAVPEWLTRLSRLQSPRTPQKHDGDGSEDGPATGGAVAPLAGRLYSGLVWETSTG